MRGAPAFSKMKAHLLTRGLRVLGGAFVLLSLPASANLATIIADRDAAIFAQNPDYNLGAGNLIAGTNAHFSDNARSLLEFNIVSSLPAGSIINSVFFQVGVIRQSNSASASAYELHPLLKDWTEGNGGVGVNNGSPALAGETTWNSEFHGATLWGTPGGLAGTDYLSSASGVGPAINSANVLYQIDSTSSLVADVQGWLDNPATNDGWAFLGSSEGIAGTARRFSSTEVPGDGIASALTPRIIVDYTTVPEPGMGISLLAGFGMLILLRLRRG